MTDKIRLLPDSVANQIAAGEVIQRPASVIKELVENAVDAGATRIDIVILDAGRTLIQVVDNGCGMSDTDARMAFERHATSKITQATDLYSLHTMGFRGEALPSVAAVAQIELLTMPQDASLGTRLVIEASRVVSQEPAACAPGTNLMVKNLFFNLPVRRKFLKKDTVELSQILREFERLALVNTSLELSVTHNGQLLHHLLPASPKRRILDLFGKNLDSRIIPVATDTSLVKIDGYVSLPEHARRRGALQYFTVNGRNMRHPYFHRAVLQCYEELVAPDMQPSYFINLTVDPDSIDVNIHPTKNEIKFENEQAIWQILTAAIRESLSRFNATAAIDFDRDDAPAIPAFDPSRGASAPMPAEDVNRAYNPFESQGPLTSRRAPVDWERLYDDLASRNAPLSPTSGAAPDTPPVLPFQPDTEAPEPTAAGTPMQYKGRYLLAPSRDGLMVIDQHRAHTLVLYHRHLSRLEGSKLESQPLLLPDTVSLSPSQSAILEAILPGVSDTGFLLDHQAGSQEWTVKAVPAALADLNPEATLLAMIDTAGSTGQSPGMSLRSRLALALARREAITPDQPLGPAEREQLLASLLSLPDPLHTPDGLRTLAILTPDDLGRLLD